MAIYRPGVIAQTISGNIGGANFVAGKGPPVIRRALQRVDHSTSLQINHRILMGRIANAWRALDADQTQSWISAAQVLQLKNRIGMARYNSGWQLFMTYWLQHPRSTAAMTVSTPEVRIYTTNATFTFETPQNGTWTATLVNGIPPEAPAFKIFVSRPHSIHAQRIYHNYFFVKSIGGTPITDNEYRPTPTSDPRLENAQIGEVIALKIIASAFGTAPFFLDSKPSFFTTTVTA